MEGFNVVLQSIHKKQVMLIVLGPVRSLEDSLIWNYNFGGKFRKILF